MARFQPFSLGRAKAAGQDLTFNRLRNEALGDELQASRQTAANRKKARSIRQLYDEMPAQIEALENEGLYDQAEQLRDNYMRTRINEVKLLESTRPYINAGNYKALRQDLIQAGAVEPEMMPVEYSDDWFKKKIKEKKGDLSKFTLKSWENGALMSRDLVTQDGAVRWDLSGSWYADPDDDPDNKKGGKGKGFTFKAADANQIGEQIERLFGGFYDPETKQPKGLDPETMPRIQSIQEEAERIYSENGGFITHGVAVTRAARNLGIVIENYRDRAADDPMSLRPRDE